MRNRLKKALLVLMSGLYLSASMWSGVVLAGANCSPKGLGIISSFPTWHKYLETTDPPECEVEAFEVPGDIWKIALAVVEMLLRIAGMVATGYVVYAGFKYVMSRGNPQEAAKARQTIIDAVIGIAIASIATVLVSFIGRTLTR